MVLCWYSIALFVLLDSQPLAITIGKFKLVYYCLLLVFVGLDLYLVIASGKFD